MQNAKRFAALAAVFVWVGAALAGPPQKSVLEAVPDDAALALIIPQIDTFVGQVSAFGKAIGNPDMENVTIEEMLGDAPMGAKGIDPKGTMVLALTPETPDSPIVIVTLSDVDAWKSAMGATEAEGGGGVLKVSRHGEEAFAAVKGNTLWIAQYEEQIKAAMKASGKFAAGLKAHSADLDKHSVFVYISIPPWKDTIEQSLGMAEGFMLMMAASPEGAAAAGIARFMLTEVRGLIADADQMTVGATLGGDAATAAFSFGVKSGSKTSDGFKQLKGSGKPTFAGLNDAPFAVAYGADWTASPDGATFSERMMRSMAESSPAADKDKVTASLKKVSAFVSKLSGMNGTLRGAGDKGMVMTVGYASADPKALLAAGVDMVESSTELSSMMTPSLKVEFSRSNETIGGSDATVLVAKYSAEDPAMLAAISGVYGGDTVTSVMMVRGDTMLGVTGNNEAVRAELSKTGGKLDDNARVGAALKAHSPKPSGVCVIDVAQMFELVRSAMGPAGAGVPQLGADAGKLALISSAYYASDTGLRVEFNLPTAPIRAVVDASGGGAGRSGGEEPEMDD